MNHPQRSSLRWSISLCVAASAFVGQLFVSSCAIHRTGVGAHTEVYVTTNLVNHGIYLWSLYPGPCGEILELAPTNHIALEFAIANMTSRSLFLRLRPQPLVRTERIITKRTDGTTELWHNTEPEYAMAGREEFILL